MDVTQERCNSAACGRHDAMRERDGRAPIVWGGGHAVHRMSVGRSLGRPAISQSIGRIGRACEETCRASCSFAQAQNARTPNSEKPQTPNGAKSPKPKQVGNLSAPTNSPTRQLDNSAIQQFRNGHPETCVPRKPPGPPRTADTQHTSTRPRVCRVVERNGSRARITAAHSSLVRTSGHGQRRRASAISSRPVCVCVCARVGGRRGWSGWSGHLQRGCDDATMRHQTKPNPTGRVCTRDTQV